MFVKNWSEFQHYRDRRPPWIKLHRSLLDDWEFSQLPDASRALAPILWLLASESEDGSIRDDVAWIAYRARKTEEWTAQALIPLIEKEFLVDASEALASCKHDASLETEKRRDRDREIRVRSRTREKAPEIPSGFVRFWDLYPRKVNKKAALREWKKAKLENGQAEQVCARLKEQVMKGHLGGGEKQYIVYPERWIKHRRWEDDLQEQKPQEEVPWLK